MFSWGPRAQGKWVGNKELGFLLCRTEKSSTSLSPKPPAAFHSLTLTLALTSGPGHLPRNARVQQGVLPWNYQLLEIHIKKQCCRTEPRTSAKELRSISNPSGMVGSSEQFSINEKNVRLWWKRARPGMCPGTWAILWICISSPRFPVWLEASAVIYPAAQFSIINWTLFFCESGGDREVKHINDCLTQISVTRASQTPGLIH